jgi:hypothetical protein
VVLSPPAILAKILFLNDLVLKYSELRTYRKFRFPSLRISTLNTSWSQPRYARQKLDFEKLEIDLGQVDGRPQGGRRTYRTAPIQRVIFTADVERVCDGAHRAGVTKRSKGTLKVKFLDAPNDGPDLGLLGATGFFAN